MGKDMISGLKSLPSFYQLLKNMGFRYVAFRMWYAVQRKSGILKLRFRRNFKRRHFITCEEWRAIPIRFFLDDLQIEDKLKLSSEDQSALEFRVNALRKGRMQYFNMVWLDSTDWHTNPENLHIYDRNKHFSEISDFSKEAGDIKYVWEKSRFTFLYDLIRYDCHFGSDQSDVVFSTIESWIRENPVNCGPNWKCSQEISIRVLNWTFALQYYKNAGSLSESRFDLIINSIFRQIRHVEKNINFSRIAVRNNHALTETFALYFVGLLYPFLPGSALRKKRGKKWFEEEIAYQIADDGTFLQYSMIYHRIVVQLLTWAIGIAEINGEKWAAVVFDRAEKSLHFLKSCQDSGTGWLPNYGANDGSLFFPMSACHFRDFRPQLSALSRVLGKSLGYGPGKWDEEAWWMGVANQVDLSVEKYRFPERRVLTFEKSGYYYVARDNNTMTFIRCGNYRSRPFQADNLHVDIWVNGKNILRDAGSYRYNADEKWTNYFAGTASHNTVMLGGHNQMRKGKRFIWYDWIVKSNFRIQETEAVTIFEGEFEGFRHLGKNIIHRRRVTRENGKLSWTVEDWIENAPAHLPMHQIWHPVEDFSDSYSIHALSQNGTEIVATYNEGWYSESYGHKQATPTLVFNTHEKYIRTIIQSRRNYLS